MGQKKETVEEMQERHRREMQEKREAVKARKARTHRLIVRGAMAEKILPGAEHMTDEEFQKKLYQVIFQRDDALLFPDIPVLPQTTEEEGKEARGSDPR